MRVPVRVFAAVKRSTKSGKPVWNQDVQIDQEDRASITTTRTYWEEDKVMAPGNYTAALTLYSFKVKDEKTGYFTERVGAAFGKFEKVK